MHIITVSVLQVGVGIDWRGPSWFRHLRPWIIGYGFEWHAFRITVLGLSVTFYHYI